MEHFDFTSLFLVIGSAIIAILFVISFVRSNKQITKDDVDILLNIVDKMKAMIEKTENSNENENKKNNNS